MAKKYFKKEYHSDYGCSYGIGSLETEQTFRNEGQDYLADVLTIDIDKDFIRIQQGKDFIDVEDVDELNEISPEDYQNWQKFFDQLQIKAQRMLDGRQKADGNL